MPETGNSADLNIILKLIDQASGELKKALGDVKKETEDLEKKSDKTTNSMTEGFKKANTQLREFRRMMSVAAFAIGTIILTTREWSFHNKETSHALSQLGEDIKSVAASIGSIFAPAIKGLADGLDRAQPAISAVTEKVRELFKAINYFSPVGAPMQFMVAYVAALRAGMGPIESWKIALNVAKASADSFNASLDTTGVENFSRATKEAEDSTKKLFETWQAWTNNSTQEPMIWATQNQAILSQDITARQSYYATIAQLDMLNSNQELQQFLKVTAAKKEALDDLTKKVTMTSRQQTTVIIGALGQLENALSGAEEMGRGFATAAAAVSLGLAIINTAQGVTKAFADYPWPFSMVVAGIIAAAGAIQVATIASTKFAGGTDSVPAMVSPGEMILPPTMSSAIRSGDIAISGRGGFGAFSGGGGQTTVTTYIDIKVDRPTVRSDTDIDTLVEEVSRRVAQEVERIR